MAETKTTRTRKTTPKPQTAAPEREKTEISPEEKAPERVYTESDVQEMIKKAISEFAANLPKTEEKPKEDNKYVTLMYLGAIAARTTVSLGKLGSFNKPGVPRNVPKELFFENLGRPVVESLLSQRRLIVLDGLTKEERERYGLDYNESEMLSKNAFFKLLDYGKDDICEIFSRMCAEHKKLIAKIYHTAYFQEHDARVNPDTVKALNVLSKDVDKDGMFALILEDMGRKFAE